MLKSFKKFTRLISFTLILLIIFNLISVSAVEVAAPLKQTPKENALKADIGELPNKAPKTKMELISKRTKYSTRYLNPDGSFTEEIYLEPQFYKDPVDKQWKEIDNNLKISNKKVGKFENKASDFNVLFSEKAGPEEIISI